MTHAIDVHLTLLSEHDLPLHVRILQATCGLNTLVIRRHAFWQEAYGLFV